MPSLCWRHHSVRVMELVAVLYKNSELTDCTLDTEGGLIHCHKTILAACSPYFKKLLLDLPGMKAIPLKEVKYSDMRLILEFMFYGEVDVSVDDVPSLMEAAKFLDVASLRRCLSPNVPGEFSSEDRCGQNVSYSGTEQDVNCVNSDGGVLSVPRDRGIRNQGLLTKKEDSFRSSCENIDLQTDGITIIKPDDVFKQLSEGVNDLATPDSVPNSSVFEKEVMDACEECLDNKLLNTPFPLVFVNIEELDEQGDLCSSDLDLRNPLEEYPSNCDTRNEINITEETGFNPECRIKLEHEEEVDGNELQATENLPGTEKETSPVNIPLNPDRNHLCFELGSSKRRGGIQSNRTVTSDKNTDTAYFENDIVERTGDVTEQTESNCDILELVLKEEKLFETDLKLENIEECDNRAPSLKQETDSMTLKEEAKESVDIVDHEPGEHGLDVANTSNMQQMEAGIALATSRSQAVNNCHRKEVRNYKLDAKTTSGFLMKCSEEQVKKKSSSKEDEVSSSCSQLLLFSSNIKLNQHIPSHSEKVLLLCTPGPSKLPCKSTPKEQVRTHRGERSHSCKICESSFNSKGSLTRHMRTHTGETPFSCTVCKASFNQNSSLLRHLITHTGEKPYICAICGSSYNQKDVLKRHMGLHSGQKPHVCNICEKSFGDKGYLRIHMRTHTGNKPYVCRICEAKFNQTSHLKRHMDIHDSEEPFVCSVCEAKFNYLIQLKRHTRTHAVKKRKII